MTHIDQYSATQPSRLLRSPHRTRFRAVHSSRNKIAGIAIGRDSLTRAFRGSEVEILALHRSPSDVAQEYPNLLGWGLPG